jgi:hypothetical protein
MRANETSTTSNEDLHDRGGWMEDKRRDTTAGTEKKEEESDTRRGIRNPAHYTCRCLINRHTSVQPNITKLGTHGLVV